MLTFGSYFTGGGLFDIGITQAGWKPLFGVEFDPSKPKLSKAIADCYEKNLDPIIIRQDVCDVDVHSLPSVTWFHASPVCVNFSTAKHGATESQIDTQTAKATAKYIKVHQPLFVSIENVIRYKDSDSLRIILEALSGYQVRASKVDLSLFNVPQNRKRLIILASRKGDISFPKTCPKTPGWYKAVMGIDFALTTLPYWVAKAHKPRPHPVYAYMINYTGTISVDYDRIWLPHEPAATVTGQSRRKFFLIKNNLPYDFSMRAFGRLQTLPDWYELPTQTERANVIVGNGVPCEFARRLGLHMAGLIKSL